MYEVYKWSANGRVVYVGRCDLNSARGIAVREGKRRTLTTLHGELTETTIGRFLLETKAEQRMKQERAKHHVSRAGKAKRPAKFGDGYPANCYVTWVDGNWQPTRSIP
jgi:hypothetical protein